MVGSYFTQYKCIESVYRVYVYYYEGFNWYLIAAKTETSTVDKSSLRSIIPMKISQSLSAMMKQYGFVNPWPFSYLSAKQYSFFSHAPRSFLRIDYFLVDKNLILEIVSTQFLPITASDHATVISTCILAWKGIQILEATPSFVGRGQFL